jgi:hypothetical protein
MIPPETKTLFQNVVTHEMFEMDRMLAGVQEAALENAASWGRPNGMALVLLTQNATNSLKTRAQFILGQLLRCLAACHVPLDTETVTEALQLLRDAIQAQANDVGVRLFQNPFFSFGGFEQARRHFQAQYDQEGPRLIDRLSTELAQTCCGGFTGLVITRCSQSHFSWSCRTRSNGRREPSYGPPARQC